MAQHTLHAQIIISGKEDGSLAKIGNQLLSMAQQVQGISEAALNFEKESVETYRSYEDGILETRSVLQSTYKSTASLNKDMEALEKHAQQWAETTIFGTSDVANAMANAAHAGWDYEKIIQGIPSAMLIAQAGNLELADGVDYLTKMMAATGTQFDQSTGFVNEWAKAADLAATDINEIGQAFIKLGTASRLADRNEELFAFFSVLANAGTTGSAAGTALRNVMARIVAPTNVAEEAMAALGISEEEAAEALSDLDEASRQAYQRLEEMGFSAFDAQGNLRPFMDILTDMNILLGDMDDRTKYDFLKTLFGTKTFQYAMSLLESANDGSLLSIYDAIVGVRDSDYAMQKADTLMSGLTGSIAITESKWEEFQRKIGEILATPLEGMMDGINTLIDGLNGLDPAILDGLTGAITTVALSAPALTTVGTALKVIGTLGISSAFEWMALGAAVIGATAAINGFVDENFESKFGDMDLDTDPLNNYLDGITNKFTALNTEASAYNELMSAAVQQYAEASTTLSGTLLTDVITGSKLTESDVDALQGLGASMHDALVAGIQNGTAGSMSWFTALFGYGGKNPNDSEAYNDIILALGLQYEQGMAEAEALGNSLGKTISDAVKDGIISGDEYDTIKQLMDRYNDAMQTYTNAQRAGEMSQMLHSAQNVSWDSYAEWATGARSQYESKLAEMDSEYWYAYGMMESLYSDWIAKGETNPATGETYTQADWQKVAEGMQADYESARGDFNSGYTKAIMEATAETLSSGGMLEAFNFLQGFNGELTNSDIQALQANNGELLNSMIAFNEGFARFTSIIGPFMSSAGIDINQWKDWIPMLVEAGRTNGVGNTDIDDQYEAERRFMLGEGMASVADLDLTAASERFGAWMNNPFGSDRSGATGTGFSFDDSMGVISVTDNGSAEQLSSEIHSIFGEDVEQNVSVTDSGSASSLRSSIEGQFSSTITQYVNVQRTGVTGQFFANGGRATEASIFGEAGAEWAIPEAHTERTADLLNAAAAASGFTWAELMTRGSGSNSNSGGTLIYSPTINTGSGGDVETVLKDDKKRLEKWWRERNQRESASSYV